MKTAKVYAGTSGYSFKEWKGAFYPPELPAAEYLRFYSERLNTVEINSTFYRFPAARILESWREETPEGFVFAIKANQGITHRGQLRDTEQLTRDFVERCGVLREKLGPILFQLPPTLRRDDARLQKFLDALPPGRRYAMEFRHSSWLDEAVYAMLAGAGLALCISEQEKIDVPRRVTAPFCYVRLRKPVYTSDDLNEWRDWVDSQAAEGRDVYIYLEHDDAGVSPAKILGVVSPR